MCFKAPDMPAPPAPPPAPTPDEAGASVREAQRKRALRAASVQSNALTGVTGVNLQTQGKNLMGE